MNKGEEQMAPLEAKENVFTSESHDEVTAHLATATEETVKGKNSVMK